MTLEVYSAKRNRVYVRKFDHDEARARHAAGETAPALAAEYGVTSDAVRRALTPDRNEHRAAVQRRWQTGECETCGGPALRLVVSAKKKHNPDGRVLCRKCRDVERRTSLRFENGLLVAVRCCLIDCVNGERWQSPENFPRGTRFRDVRPGGIHGACRACNTAIRRAYREKTRVPCSHGCGTMVNTADRSCARDKPPECHACAVRRYHAERKASA